MFHSNLSLLEGNGGIYTGWWFQTCFIFHNIWDNPSHWLSYFSEGLKPPTRSTMLIDTFSLQMLQRNTVGHDQWFDQDEAMTSLVNQSFDRRFHWVDNDEIGVTHGNTATDSISFPSSQLVNFLRQFESVYNFGGDGTQPHKILVIVFITWPVGLEREMDVVVATVFFARKQRLFLDVKA